MAVAAAHPQTVATLIAADASSPLCPFVPTRLDEQRLDGVQACLAGESRRPPSAEQGVSARAPSASIHSPRQQQATCSVTRLTTHLFACAPSRARDNTLRYVACDPDLDETFQRAGSRTHFGVCTSFAVAVPCLGRLAG